MDKLEKYPRIINSTLPKYLHCCKASKLNFFTCESLKTEFVPQKKLSRNFLYFSMLSMKELPANFNYLSNNLKVGEEVVAYPYDVSVFISAPDKKG